MRYLLPITLMLFLGCSLPATSVRSVDTRPSISVSWSTETADLYVDGIRMGRGREFVEPNRLTLEPGTHKVSLVEGGKATFEQTIFIESEHRTIIPR